MRLWTDTQRTKAQELIDWLLSAKTDTGWPIDWVNIIAFAELSSLSLRPNLTQSLIMQVLSEMSASGKRTVDDFEEIFEQRIRANTITMNKQTGRWQFFIPIGVAISDETLAQRPRIRILGKDFSLLPLPSVKRRLDRESREALASPFLVKCRIGVKIEHIPKVFLSVSAQAPSWNLAWKDVEPAFDALRGLIELSFGLYEWRISAGEIRARSKVPHPLWMIAYKKGAAAEWLRFFTDENEDSTAKTFNLDDTHLARIQENATLLRREPDPQSTLALIADCLRLYSQAMDARFRHLSFLGLWQLAEAITNSETIGGNTDKVATRLGWHGAQIGLKGSGYQETLKVLGKKRNDIVHRGIHAIEDDDINILKLACEVALIWLFQVHKSLPTIAHINHYYRLREMNQADLEAIRDCVVYLAKQKRK